VSPGQTVEQLPDASDTPTIELSNDSGDDARIQQRLTAIFSKIDSLADVTIRVESSVVELSGTVENTEAATRAHSLATQLEGVAQVSNLIDVNRDVAERVETAVDQSVNLFQRFLQLIPLLAVGLAVFLASWWAGKWVGSHYTLVARFTPNVFIAQLVATLFRMGVVIAGLVIALYLLDLTSIIGTVLGAAGIVGLALGFAVKDTVENFIASILLSIRHPFSTNDYIEIDGQLGRVARLTARATILISPDGNHVRIPNAQVFKAVIINYSLQPQRRISFTVSIDESAPLNLAFESIHRTLKNTDGVLDDPPPSVTIEELQEATTLVGVYFWIDQRKHDFLAVKSLAMIEVKIALRDAHIDMPSSKQVLQIERSNPQATGPDTHSKGSDHRSDTQGSASISIDTNTTDPTRKHTEQATAEGENLLDTKASSE